MSSVERRPPSRPMIYQDALFSFLSFAGVMVVLAMMLRIMHRTKASFRMFLGILGAGLGFLIAPPLAVAAGFIPSQFIEWRYFREPFSGCILPSAGLTA